MPTTDFNNFPYYDDFDEDKKFLKILYRPGFAVQSRELTQMQTLLQNQVKRLGDHIFRDGSMVIPGDVGVDFFYSYVRLQPQFAGADIDVNNFLGQTVVGLTSGATGRVVNVRAAENGDDNTLYVKYNAGSSTRQFQADTGSADPILRNLSVNPLQFFVRGAVVTGPGILPETTILDVTNTTLTLSKPAQAAASGVTLTAQTSAAFADDETIATTSLSENFSARTVVADATGFGSSAYINRGVYYSDGYFILVEDQTNIISKYDNRPSVVVGLQLNKSIVVPEEDESLLDPAQGSTNFNAPGAHRYKIDPQLVGYGIGEAIPEDDDFIELIRIRNGVVERLVDRSFYNELEKNLARRTFDTNGNYTVRFFPIDVREHLNDGDNRGIYLPGEGGNEALLAVGLEPGKAYVKGFEIETLTTTFIDVEKGRDIQEAQNVPTIAEVGNFVEINGVRGTFNISTFDTVNIHSDVNGGGGVIGNARVRSMSIVSGTAGTVDAVYRLYLFDIRMDSDSFGVISFAENAKSIASLTGDRGNLVLVGGEAVIREANRRPAIFPTPNEVLRTMRDNFGQVDTNYRVRRLYTGTMSENGGDTITFTCGGTEFFSAFSIDGYHLSIVTPSPTAIGNGFAAGDIINLAGGGNSVVLGGAPVGRQVSVTVPAISGSDVRVLTTLRKTISNQKIKTLISDFQEAVSHDAIIQLGRADIYRLKSVVTDEAVPVDVTSKYTLDNGQRDSFYDRGRLLLRSGEIAPDETSLIVTYDYFEHGAGDYFNVDSYDGVIPYEDIPSYTSVSSGVTFQLRDVFDFRPRMNNAGTALVGGSEFPIPNEEILADYDFYLNRIDRIFLTPEGDFRVRKGIPSLTPVVPAEPSDGMSLYTLEIPAYTFSTDDVRIRFIDNRRYTMRDIGALERRIERVEYYTSLSLLEKDTETLFIDDGTGLNRFKNGFVVDNFTGHRVGDVSNPDYKCAIDPARGELRPSFNQDAVEIEYVPAQSAGVVQTGRLLTVPYTEQPIISQTFASRTENINPYEVFSWNGTIEMSPSSDTWRDTETRPDLVVNQEGLFDNIRDLANAAGVLGTQWNEWSTNWIGVTGPNPTEFRGIATREGVRTDVVPLTVRQNIGTRVVDVGTVPFMRSIDVSFVGTRFKPNTRLYAFFDGVDVNAFVRPVDGNYGDPIVSDANGRVEGIFTIPNNENLRFRTGQRQFRLTDDALNRVF